MVDIMSLTKMGGQVALTVTPEDLHNFANALLAQSRKEWEEQVASVRTEESEETFLTTEEVCNFQCMSCYPMAVASHRLLATHQIWQQEHVPCLGSQSHYTRSLHERNSYRLLQTKE